MLARKLVLLASLALSTQLHAATEFPGGVVPMDIVREFSGATLYQGLPDDFPPISLPPGLDLRLVASTSENYSQKVVLRTSLSRDALYEQLRSALPAQGWLDISLSYLLRFCHDQYGTLSVSVNTSSSGGNRVEVTRSSYPVPLTCSEQQAQAEANAAWSSFYTARFPVLEAPPEALTTNPSPYILRSGSSSSSGRRIDMNNGGSIEVPDTSVADLHEYFALQMQDQGWQMDSSANGERGATSVWIMSADAPELSSEAVDMLVTLSVVHGTGDAYGISIKLQSPPDAGSGFDFYSSFF